MHSIWTKKNKKSGKLPEKSGKQSGINPEQIGKKSGQIRKETQKNKTTQTKQTKFKIKQPAPGRRLENRAGIKDPPDRNH